VAASGAVVSLRVEPCRAASQACAVVAIPLATNYWVFRALRAGVAEALLAVDRFDETVVAFAAFEAAEEKLRGSTAAAIKNRVSAAACGAQGGEFLISATCAPTLAAARKCAGIILRSLRWGGLFRRYSEWCRVLGAGPDRGAFCRAAARARASMLAGVEVVLAGKVEASPEGAQRTAELLARKLRQGARPREKGRARALSLPALRDGAQTPLELFSPGPAPGLLGVVALNFANSNGRGEPAHLVSGILFIPKRGEGLVRSLARGRRAAKFAVSFLRLGREARGALVYFAALGCLLASADLCVGGGQAPSPRAVVGAIQAAFEE
jgi:hypothetical protein